MMPLLLLAAICLAFFFSGLEAGLTSVNRLRLRQRAREGLLAAQRLEALLEHPGRLMASVVLVTVTARILALAFLYASLEGRFGQWAALGVVLVSLPLLVVVLDFLPKVLFRRFPYRKLLLFATLLQGVAWLLTPFTWLAARFAAPRFEHLARRPLAGLAELRNATNEAVAAGALTPLQKHYLHSLLSARTTPLADVARPLSEWPQVAPDEKIARLLELARTRGDEFFLVTQSGPHGPELLGSLRIFDLLIDGISSGTAQSYMRRLPELSADLFPLAALLALRSQRADMAVLTPSSHGEVNVITSRDLIRRVLHGSNSAPARPAPRGP